MPMILVKKNPRGKVIRELSSEEETAVKTVCGLKKPATMAQHNLANDLLREMREYDAWLQCDCIPGDSPAMNFAALKNNTGTLYLSSFNHEHAPECPMYRQLSGNEEETSFGASRHPVSTRINYRNFLPPDDSNSVIRLQTRSAYHNGERSSVRKKRPRLGRLLLSLIEDAGLNKLDSLWLIPVSGLIIVSVLMPYGRLHYSRSIFGEDPYLKLSISGRECLKGLRSG